MKSIDQRSELISKKKTTAKQSVLVNLVLDESGSMSSCLDKTLDGFNKYINELKTQANNIKFTLTKFSGSKTDIVYKAKNIKSIPPLTKKTYIPNNDTPLFDAIGKTAAEIEKHLSKTKNDCSVLFVIMTDGEENASKEFNKDQVCELIKQKEKDGWTFVYLGANQDAFKVGGGLGIVGGNTFTYTNANIHRTFNTLSASTIAYNTNATRNVKYKTKDFFNSLKDSTVDNDTETSIQTSHTKTK